MTPSQIGALRQLSLTPKSELRFDERLARRTTLRVGGPAACWAQVATFGDLKRVLGVCSEEGIPWTVIGGGSNLLVSDQGFPGVVVHLCGEFRTWNYDEESLHFTVGAAVSLSRIVQEAFRRGLSGMEFAVGTPGTVGGAIRMNAGTSERGMSTRVVSVTTYDPDRGLKRYAASDIQWGYRSTSFSPHEVILECVLSVKPGQEAFIRAKMEGSLARRKRTQPLDFPSCGSVFRNPSGQHAGALIEGCGLSGTRIGGAQISGKHANFIVNTGEASAHDVIELIQLAQHKVKQEHGIELKPEVRFLGF
ncbi:MAG: UDP-N-acetylmuramate dehydrogenase [Eggerthellaceae bacterium]|nr:UDP-N-acetylmuramate dehydrogenase [Eggerthellaceae bacterium]